ncbi:MAG: nucleotidyltransferase domain-containing protein [Terriglobales bacterium]
MRPASIAPEEVQSRDSDVSAARATTDIYDLLVTISSPERQVNLQRLGELDWDLLLSHARHHSLVPLLAHRLLECGDRAMLTTHIRARLRTEFQSNLLRNLNLLEEIKRLLAAWHAAGIQAIPYKGPVMAEQLWGSIALRECSDLDFLVRREHVNRAGEVLLESEYGRVSPVAASLRPALLRNASEEQFRHPRNNILLELQWAPAPRTLAVNFDEEQLWRNVTSIDVAGQPMNAPSSEGLIGLLVIHGWKHNWSKLIWIADLAALISNNDVDWDLLDRSARRSGWLRILLLGLEMARRIYGLESPLGSDQHITALAEELEQHLQAATNHTYLRWHRDMLRTRDRHCDQFRQLRNFIFTPGLAEYAVAKLPAWASPVYWMIRVTHVLQLWPAKALE